MSAPAIHATETQIDLGIGEAPEQETFGKSIDRTVARVAGRAWTGNEAAGYGGSGCCGCLGVLMLLGGGIAWGVCRQDGSSCDPNGTTAAFWIMITGAILVGLGVLTLVVACCTIAGVMCCS